MYIYIPIVTHCDPLKVNISQQKGKIVWGNYKLLYCCSVVMCCCGAEWTAPVK